MVNDPLWYKDAVFYEIAVRAYKDGNGDGHSDLHGLTEKLEYLQTLGVDCIWLMPIYPSPLRDDGYDIADYYNIAETFGTLDDLKTLIHEAHSRDIRIIMDLVLNHTSDAHPWFQASRSDKNSPYRDYYVWSDTDQSIKTRASSFSIPSPPIGPGMKRPVNIIGIVSMPVVTVSGGTTITPTSSTYGTGTQFTWARNSRWWFYFYHYSNTQCDCRMYKNGISNRPRKVRSR